MRNTYSPFPVELVKLATAIMTPEAMQAAVQPPMDPAMGGGMPMDPAMAGAAAADPAMAAGAAGGMPAQTEEYGGMSGSRGGQIPPEILQDALFMSFLQSIGIVMDQASGNFIGPDGAPLSVDEIVQIYQMFQEQLAQQQAAPEGGAAPGAMDQGMAGSPAGAPPMDPSAMGGAPAGAVPPEAAAPMDAGMGAPAGMPADMGAGLMPPEAAPAEAAPEEAAMAPEAQADPIMEIASAVMSGVEAVMEEQMAAVTEATAKKLDEMMDRIEALAKAVDALQQTTDDRAEDQKKRDENLIDQLGEELNPVTDVKLPEPEPLDINKEAAAAPVKPVARPANLFSLIMSQKKS